MCSSLVMKEDFLETAGEVVMVTSGSCSASTVRLDVEAILCLGARAGCEFSIVKKTA